MAGPIVQIEQGSLEGRSVDFNKTKYNSFKGIPYAAPPVGDLRFSAPRVAEPWSGILKATEDPNIGPQFDIITQSVIGAEDCLYLNVYTPSLPESNKPLLPVMFFIHGGGFVYGNGTIEKDLSPDYLMEKDVVLVTINYRLGILGFLSLDLPDAPGNMGLKDQVQALKWAIPQSGSSLCPWACNTKVKELALKIASLVDKSDLSTEELLKHLKEIPVTELIILSAKLLATEKSKGGLKFDFVPTIESQSGDWENFLDQSPYELLMNGQFAKVPLMSGICEREGLVTAFLNPDVFKKCVQDKDFVTVLPFELDNEQFAELRKRLNEIYYNDDNKYGEEDFAEINFLTDFDFLSGVYIAATSMAKAGIPVYFYEFSYDGNLNIIKKSLQLIDRKGAIHSDEIGYLFGMSTLPKDVTKTDQLMRERMTMMWSNFAKYSNPTPQTNDLLKITWEPMQEGKNNCYVIDENLSLKRDIYPARINLFLELYDKYYK